MEIGWVIVKGDSPEINYLSLDEVQFSTGFNVSWSTNHLDALRFARDKDARDFARVFLNETVKIEEHAWN